jgi:hypothetical protein
MLYLRNTILAAMAFSVVALAQPNVTLDSPYQVRYASNLNIGDSVINLTNTGARGAGLQAGTSVSITGSICVNVYAFSPDEQMISCCTCPVTPNGLRSLSVVNDLINNTLTPAVPTSVVVKLLASAPVGGGCNAAAPGPLTSGLLAWGSTLKASPGGGYEVVETPFLPATLSGPGTAPNIGEFQRLVQLCTFIQANGSGFGICDSCQLGGMGAGRR